MMIAKSMKDCKSYRINMEIVWQLKPKRILNCFADSESGFCCRSDIACWACRPVQGYICVLAVNIQSSRVVSMTIFKANFGSRACFAGIQFVSVLCYSFYPDYMIYLYRYLHFMTVLTLQFTVYQRNMHD